jgi:glycosyltransferase involved in cell wall biosynthesis
LNITFLCSVNLWSPYGGAALYERKVAETLSRNHDVTVMFGSKDIAEGNAPPEIRTVQLPVSGMSLLSRIFAGLSCQDKTDLIVDCSDIGGPWFSPFFHRKRKKILLAHQLWREIFDYELKVPLGLGMKHAEEHFYRLYKGVPSVAASESTANSLRQLGIRTTKVIPPGIDESLVSNGENTENKGDHPVLVVLGRLRRYKGVQFSLLAFKSIVQKFPDARLKIIGDGPYFGPLKSFALTLGLSNVVDFLGRVDDETKVEVLSSAHILLNTSLREGFGINVLEAAANHVPCIGWNVPGTRDAVEDGKTGILVEPLSIKALTEAVIELLINNEKRVEMARKAHDRAVKFTWNKTCSEFEKFMSKVAPT